MVDGGMGFGDGIGGWNGGMGGLEDEGIGG